MNVKFEDYEMLNEIKFSTFEACKIVNLNYDSFQGWLRYGLIDIKYKARGHGDRSIISLDDLLKMFLFKFLLDCGMKRDKASKMMNNYFSLREVERLEFGPFIDSDFDETKRG